jgi:aspartate aminotransferase-like enzyme
MPGLLPHVDPDGLLEYSVVYTDRALNHMSRRFQGVMGELHALLCQAYGAAGAAIVPGSGTFGMEAVARQFAAGQEPLVLRNGWFSYRWTQIFEMGGFTRGHQVLKARRAKPGDREPFAPAPLEEVLEHIRREQPAVVFAPHVETSAGLMLPDHYLAAVGQAVHAHGGLFVLDIIASGAMWVDMARCEVDVLVSAPQKGWSGSPGCAFVMFSERALARLEETTNSSFAMDLKKWRQIMQAYLGGGHAYHATMPTDSLVASHAAMVETRERGFASLREQQLELGLAVRRLMQNQGYPSVAAAGFEAPGVVVSYTDDAAMQNSSAFLSRGLQTAAGVPLMCDEGPGFRTFRVGLFGLEKLAHVDRTVARLQEALAQLATPAALAQKDAPVMAK